MNKNSKATKLIVFRSVTVSTLIYSIESWVFTDVDTPGLQNKSAEENRRGKLKE